MLVRTDNELLLPTNFYVHKNEPFYQAAIRGLCEIFDLKPLKAFAKEQNKELFEIISYNE